MPKDMKYFSTNNPSKQVSLKEAVLNAFPADKGLYLPTEIPALPHSFFDSIDKLPFQDMAFEVAKTLIQDSLPEKTLRSIVADAVNFDAPLVPISENTSVLELFHGPTLAFKDFGARFMARLMGVYTKEDSKKLTILVATSGDTGSAVAQGFYRVPGIEVMVFYPKGQVSEIQEKQFTTLGENITAFEVNGTFDDCQALVKEAFLHPELNKAKRLTSANSINIARLIPQTFYYFRAYAQLAQKNNLVFSVPSGNFGNLTAGLIAKKMGLPVSKFIASTNINDIVPHYLDTGRFEPKPSKQTISNAMDVGNPSNFARMLSLYHSIEMTEDIYGASFNDEQTRGCIKKIYQETGYLLDPHGAVGYLGLEKYQRENKCQGIVLGTAHPAKFLDVVEPVIGEKVAIPDRLAESMNKEKKTVSIEPTIEAFLNFLGTSISG
jgi:threonine synthase